MTTPTLTPADIAAEAHAVMHEALGMLKEGELSLTFPARLVVAAALRALDEALNDYDALASGTHWEAVYPDCADLAASPEPEYDALMRTAREAEACAEQLVRAIAAHGGTQAMQALTGAAS